MKALRNTLLALAAYMTVVGALFLFAPGVAEKAFSTSLPDHALTPLYGELMIVIALMAYLVSTDVSAYKKLVIAFIVSEIGHVLIFGYQLMTDISTFAQVGPPMIIAIIFTALLFVFRGKA